MRVRYGWLLLAALLLLTACQPMDKIEDRRLQRQHGQSASSAQSMGIAPLETEPEPTVRDPWQAPEAPEQALAHTPEEPGQPPVYRCAFGAVQRLDLNGDGVEETLTVNAAENTRQKDAFCLEAVNINAVNQLPNVYPTELKNLRTDGYFIVDLDESDGFLELALLDGGEDDPTTTFLRYDGGQLYALGTVGGYYGQASVLQRTRSFDVAVYGDGTIASAEPFSIAPAYRGSVAWRLQDGGLSRISQAVYPVMETPRAGMPQMTAGASLRLYAEAASTAPTSSLPAGTRITLTGCDNLSFVQVAADGTVGYLRVQDGEVEADGGFLAWNAALIGLQGE